MRKSSARFLSHGKVLSSHLSQLEASRGREGGEDRPGARSRNPERKPKDLEDAKQWRDPGCAARVEKLLASLQGRRLAVAEALIRFHDSLLFLRAFPQGPAVVEKAEELLAQIEPQVRRLRESGSDMEPFESEAVSGIAGTRLSDTFTYEVARWLTQRYPQQVRAAWDIEEQARSLAIALPRFLPLLEDDSLVEADTPYLEWMKSAAGEGRELAWLLKQFEDVEIPIAQKTEIYDALSIELHWELEAGRASRTLARRPVNAFFFHESPLIRRNQVSLDAEFASAELPVRSLSRQEGEEILDMCRDAVTVRYRELYGTTRGDPSEVYEANPGRGVQIFLWGVPTVRRLPLRAYHAGFTLKNGVPINYIEGISLFEWMEVGFNTFYAYRDGETAWIYAKALHFLRQLTGVSCFSVYPYQLGHENEEAIRSGAFWFYRKLGFRPGRPELLAMTEKEERKIAASKDYRTSARTLRKLAAGHAFYELGEQLRGSWDNFSTRKIGFAVQQHLARDFSGSAGKMRLSTRETLSRILKVDLKSWSTLEKNAFDNFAFMLSLAPEIEHWTTSQKQALVEIIRAKAGASETLYLQLLLKHEALREAVLRLGSRSFGNLGVDSPRVGCVLTKSHDFGAN